MEPDIRYLINQGKTFFANQAYKKAETLFLKIVGAKNEFADVYNMLGLVYHQTGQFSKAINNFQKALKINPHYTEAMLHLSLLYNDIGEYKLSKKLLNQTKRERKKAGSKIDPLIKNKLANKHAEAGNLYRGVGMYDSAISEYKKALALAPNFYDIRTRLGTCLREEGKKKEALKEFQKIVKEKSSFADAHVQMGITLYSLGKKKEARAVWSKLARLNPKHQLARMYLKLSEVQQSKKRAKGGKRKKK